MSRTEEQPKYALSQDDKTMYPWYISSIAKYLVPSTQRLLLEYSHIPLQDQSAHVHRIVRMLLDMANFTYLQKAQRDQAFAIRSYPCTGLGVFLVPFIPHTPIYSTILSQLRRGALLVDVGCFMGNDLRQLAFDGAPTNNMFGVDIVSHWEVGLEMYKDSGTFQANFIEADITSSNERLVALHSQADLIGISAVMHQFDLETQLTLCKAVIQLSKRGCSLLGYQIGSDEEREDDKLASKIFFQ